MDLCQPIEDFLRSPVKDEILRFRQTDRGRLEAAHRTPVFSPTTTHSTEGNPTP
jgi:cyclic pyranopterin phosphate synthase